MTLGEALETALALAVIWGVLEGILYLATRVRK